MMSLSQPRFSQSTRIIVTRSRGLNILPTGSAGSCCRTRLDEFGCGQRAGLRQIEFVMVLNMSGQSAAPLGPAWISNDPRVVTGRA